MHRPIKTPPSVQMFSLHLVFENPYYVSPLGLMNKFSIYIERKQSYFEQHT